MNDITRPIRLQESIPGKIVIEDDCWIGANVTITRDVTIGRGSVIGANSVVTRDIPEYSVAVGVPARVIRNRRSGKWER
jgi:acetyltransferase-like isoleucine patch superfamily enzyme